MGLTHFKPIFHLAIEETLKIHIPGFETRGCLNWQVVCQYFSTLNPKVQCLFVDSPVPCQMKFPLPFSRKRQITVVESIKQAGCQQLAAKRFEQTAAPSARWQEKHQPQELQ